MHRCQIIFIPERAPNVMIENLFSSIVVSFYTQANSDWKMVKSEQWFQPAPYYDGLQNTTVLVSGLHSDPHYIPIPITFRSLLHSDPRIENLPRDRNVTGIGM